MYRAEVGSCVIGLLYLTLVALLLAWRGETFRRIQGPAGAGVETPARIISSAAEWFVQYEAENAERLAEIEGALDGLHERVQILERRLDKGFSERV